MLFQLFLNSGSSMPDTDIQDLTIVVFKIMFLIAAFIYVLFAIVVVRQISIMRSTLITEFSPVLTTLGYAHLLMAVGVLIFFVLTL